MPPTLSPNIANMLSQLANRQANLQTAIPSLAGAMPYSIAPSGGIPKVQMGQGGSQVGPAMPQPAAPQNTIQPPQPAQPASLPQSTSPSTVAGIPTPASLVQNLQYYLQNGMLPTPAQPGGNSGSTPTLADVGNGSTSYTPALSQAMQITGVNAGQWGPYLNWLVKQESSGDPNAVNPTPVNGEHATGLLQTLPSTFKANAAPGMTNINDPVANAVAAINYIKNRYGSPGNIPGIGQQNYKGY